MKLILLVISIGVIGLAAVLGFGVASSKVQASSQAGAKAHVRDPNAAKSRDAFAACDDLIKRGQASEAIAALEEIERGRPALAPLAAMRLGGLYEAKRDFSQARAQYAIVLKADPHRFQSSEAAMGGIHARLIRMALAEGSQARLKDAIKDWEVRLLAEASGSHAGARAPGRDSTVMFFVKKLSEMGDLEGRDRLAEAAPLSRFSQSELYDYGTLLYFSFQPRAAMRVFSMIRKPANPQMALSLKEYRRQLASGLKDLPALTEAEERRQAIQKRDDLATARTSQASIL